MLAYRFQSLCSFLLLAPAAVLVAGCPDEPTITGDDTGTSTGATETGGTCMPGQVTACSCPGGGEGMRTCADDGSGFGPCECTGTSLDTGSSTTEPPDGTGPVVECWEDEDCADFPVDECEYPDCNTSVGMCRALPLPEDTPCGDASEGECNAPDSCDGAGNCRDNHATEGSTCEGCGEGECSCAAGLCGACTTYTATNNFTTARSIEGWELTGSWGLHRAAPQSELEGPSEFLGQVLGSNGNRVAPFPGNEVEVSYARTPPVVLPETIAFLSWNVDEGGGLSDNKTVRVSVDDGVTWQTLADCAVDPSWAFCQPTLAQDPAVFSLAEIPVPAELQGQLGRVEFGYDTGDECCGFEKGWFIDSLNVATPCACVEDADCAGLDTECGTAYCTPWGECALQGLPDDTPCGDPFANDCNGADMCDGVGYCRDNVQPTGLSFCSDCPGGGVCAYCDAGQCLDCQLVGNFSDFSNPSDVANWTVQGASADWGLYVEAPASDGGSAIPFPNAPVYGTDGNRQSPYPGAESEDSNVTTTEGVIPAQVTFLSWNVDEGDFFDTKRIELSVDGGATWTTLVDCGLGSNQPFCTFREIRAADEWDFITLDTSAWEGQTGQLRFSYSTGDSCCGFERGWFIDDLTFTGFCADEAFPQ